VTVRPGTSVILTDLRIRGGAGTDGGGIRNAGTLVLRDIRVRDNRARHGAGIWNRAGGSLRLNGSSVVQGNTAVRDGGGVWNAGELMLQDASAVRGNSATRAGGIWNDSSGSLTLADGSAIRGNVATRFGGGAWTRGTLVMLGTSVIADNRAVRYEGGGLYVGGGTLEGVICAPEPAANVRGNSPDQCFTPSG
jgi:hypothetical protein